MVPNSAVTRPPLRPAAHDGGKDGADLLDDGMLMDAPRRFSWRWHLNGVAFDGEKTMPINAPVIPTNPKKNGH